jgi:hypothetical protein
MKSKKPESRPMLDKDDAGILLRIAGRLDARAPRLTRRERIVFAAQLRHIAKPRREPRSEAEQNEFDAARSYRGVIELQGKSRWKRIRGKVAKLYGYKSDQTVSNVATKWELEVSDWLSRMEHNIEYDGISRAEMLKRALREIDAGSLLDP